MKIYDHILCRLIHIIFTILFLQNCAHRTVESRIQADIQPELNTSHSHLESVERDTQDHSSNRDEVIVLASGVTIKRLTDRTWLHTSTVRTEQWGDVSANGIVVNTDAGGVLIDTPWNDEQTARLLEWAATRFERPVRKAILTHAHDDCMGGIGALRAAGVHVIAHEETSRLMVEGGSSQPDEQFATELSFQLGNLDFDIFYPGPGHALDNIVVWIVQERVLFGGCLLKSLDARGLGNTADADVGQWPRSVESVRNRYPAPVIVVPGHGVTGGRELIIHTLELLRRRK